MYVAEESDSGIVPMNYSNKIDLKAFSLRSKTQTVSVYTRHSAKCSKKGEPLWKRCKCGKFLYLLRDGKNKVISAKTRSWEKAEQEADKIRESWDPVKQKLRELNELKQAQELGEVTIAYALERWLASVKADSDCNEHTHSKYQTAAKHTYSKYQTAEKHIGAWARSKQRRHQTFRSSARLKSISLFW